MKKFNKIVKLISILAMATCLTSCEKGDIYIYYDNGEMESLENNSHLKIFKTFEYEGRNIKASSIEHLIYVYDTFYCVGKDTDGTNYLINYDYKSDKAICLYKSNDNTGNINYIRSNFKNDYFIISDIYYSNYSYVNATHTFIDKDGAFPTISNNSYYSNDYYYYDGNLIYHKNGILRICNDHSSFEFVEEGTVKSYSYYDGFIYYLTVNDEYKIYNIASKEYTNVGKLDDGNEYVTMLANGYIMTYSLVKDYDRYNVASQYGDSFIYENCLVYRYDRKGELNKIEMPKEYDFTTQMSYDETNINLIGKYYSVDGLLYKYSYRLTNDGKLVKNNITLDSDEDDYIELFKTSIDSRYRFSTDEYGFYKKDSELWKINLSSEEKEKCKNNMSDDDYLSIVVILDHNK